MATEAAGSVAHWIVKFRVKKGDAAASDHVGPLNLNLAGRLEIALVLADDIKEPLGIIRNADAVAATLPGANHLTTPGRQALFRGRYPLAWGDAQVEPNAFLTGVAVVSPDRKKLTVGIMAFRKDGEKLDNVAQFTASTDAPTLAEAKVTFVIRKAALCGRMGRYADAEPLYRRSLEIREKKLGRDHRDVALSLANPRPGREKERLQQIDRLSTQERELSRQLGQAAGRPAHDDPWVAPDEVRRALPTDVVLVEIARSASPTSGPRGPRSTPGHRTMPRG